MNLTEGFLNLAYLINEAISEKCIDSNLDEVTFFNGTHFLRARNF